MSVLLVPDSGMSVTMLFPHDRRSTLRSEPVECRNISSRSSYGLLVWMIEHAVGGVGAIFCSCTSISRGMSHARWQSSHQVANYWRITDSLVGIVRFAFTLLSGSFVFFLSPGCSVN